MAFRNLGGHLRTALVLAALLAASGLASAQEAPERITDVRIDGLRRVSRDRVMEAIRLRPGDLFSPRAVDEDVRRLSDLGVFLPTGINVRREAFAGGVRLIFDLRERPVLRTLRFEGNRAIDEAKLREAVGMKPGDFVDVTRASQTTAAIQDLYRRLNFQFVQVEREDAPDEAAGTDDVTFIVKEGPKVALKAVRFEGNKAFDPAKLLEPMQIKAGAGAFDEAAFNQDLVKLRQFYRRSGYLDALVTGEYEYSPDKTELTVVVKVDEGQPYRVGSVSVVGQESATAEELMKDFRLKPGAVMSGDDYEHDVQSIVKYYETKGFMDVRVEPKESFPEPGVVDLVLEVFENRQVKLGLLEIRGNTKTKDKVIRREFGIYPGDLMDGAKVEEGVERLRSMRYFSKVDTSFTRGDLPDERNLVVEVEEGRTGRIGFGAGVNSDSGVVGLFDLSLENFDITDWPKSFGDLWNGNAFVGGGQRLLIQLSPGSELSQARLYFYEPSINDTMYSFASDLYVWTRERESYDETRTGGRITLGRRFNDRLTGRLTFRLESVDIGSLDDDAPPDVLAVEGKSSIYSLIAGLDYDRTDSHASPSSGYRVGGSVEIAGGDYKFVKGQVDGRYYRTLYTQQDGRKHVLALTGRLGAMKGSGSGDTPLFERFYAGGRDSLRGFAYRGASPRQIDTPVGGEFLALGSAEYVFPVYKSEYKGQPYEMVRGVVFLDFGKVAYALDDIGAEKFRAAAGVGVRLMVPALGRVPIAIDLGFPISKEDGDEEQLFSFSLGAEF